MPRPLSGRAAAIRSAIHAFLTERLEAKQKGLPDDDPQRAKLAAQFERTAWIADAAHRSGQIQFVTHTLKATHPGAQGSSLHADPAALPDHGLVGSGCLAAGFSDDVVGNAAALDVVQFLRVQVDDQPLLALMRADDADLPAALSDDEAQARAWVDAFMAMGQPRGSPASHTLAKQLYWLVGDDPLDDEAYHLLAPLYASSLAHAVFQALNADRFGDTVKAARQARREGAFSNVELHDYPDLAVQKLGGTKPQNISQLNSERRGANQLLASLPPLWTRSGAKPPLHTDSVFPRFGGRPAVKSRVKALKRLLESDPAPNKPTRIDRDDLAMQLVDELFELEVELRLLEPGWSALPACRLSEAERCWLDPDRAETDAAFAALRAQGDWPLELCRQFANWLNAQLGGSQDDKLTFGDPAHHHWYRLLRDELRARQREGLIDV